MDWFLYDNGLRHERVKMVSMDEVKKVVLKLNSKNLPSMVPFEIHFEVHLKHLTNTINLSLKECTFPEELKQSELYIYIKNVILYRRRIINQ